MEKEMKYFESVFLGIKFLSSTDEKVEDYGIIIPEKLFRSGQAISFYKGNVEEDPNLDFQLVEHAVVRKKLISHYSPDITWLERHLNMPQLFIGYGGDSFTMILAKPNHTIGGNIPSAEDLRMVCVPAGHLLMIHAGTWHNFPMESSDLFALLKVSQDEVEPMLDNREKTGEICGNDVFKSLFVAVPDSFSKYLIRVKSEL